MATGHRPIGGADNPRPENDAQAWPPLSQPPGSLTIGVIDTGIVLDQHGRPPTWFGDHVSYCAEDDYDELVLPAGGRLPSEGHGTFVAGLVLREAPTARVRLWGVLGKDRTPFNRDLASESTEDDDKAVAAALAALALNPSVQVVNLSFAGTVFEQRGELKVLEGAVADFHTARPDVAIVAAAGNRSIEDVVFPAGFDNVLSVGALDTRELAPDGFPPVAHFSNHGDWVDVYAGGVEVRGPLPQSDGSQWARWSGTSFASALVAGRIAQVAIEERISGADAQTAVVAGATSLLDGKLWVRGVDDQLL